MIADPCCTKCRTPSGICRTRHTCPHHIEADLRQRINDNRKITQYRDPVAELAVARADRSRRKQRKP